jgi:hypothetical protein
MPGSPKPVSRAFHVPAQIELRAALQHSPEVGSDTPLPMSADRPRRITQRADILAVGLVDPTTARRIGGDIAAATVRWVQRGGDGRRRGRLARSRRPQQFAGVSKQERRAARHLAAAASLMLADSIATKRQGAMLYHRPGALHRANDLVATAPATGVLVAGAAFKQIAADEGIGEFAIGLMKAIANGLARAEDRLQFTAIETGATPAIETFVNEYDPEDPTQVVLVERFAELWERNGRFEQARALYGVLRDADGAARVAMEYARYLLTRGGLEDVVVRLRDDGERGSAFTRGELLVAAYGVADRKADREHIDTLAEDFLRFAEALRDPATETVEPMPLRIVAASRPAARKEVVNAAIEASREFSAEVAELIALGRASGDGFSR